MEFYCDSPISNLGFTNGIYDLFDIDKKIVGGNLPISISPYRRGIFKTKRAVKSLENEFGIGFVLHNEIFHKIWTKKFESFLIKKYKENYIKFISPYYHRFWKIKDEHLDYICEKKMYFFNRCLSCGTYTQR